MPPKVFETKRTYARGRSPIRRANGRLEKDGGIVTESTFVWRSRGDLFAAPADAPPDRRDAEPFLGPPQVATAVLAIDGAETPADAALRALAAGFQVGAAQQGSDGLWRPAQAGSGPRDRLGRRFRTPDEIKAHWSEWPNASCMVVVELGEGLLRQALLFVFRNGALMQIPTEIECIEGGYNE